MGFSHICRKFAIPSLEVQSNINGGLCLREERILPDPNIQIVFLGNTKRKQWTQLENALRAQGSSKRTQVTNYLKISKFWLAKVLDMPAKHDYEDDSKS